MIETDGTVYQNEGVVVTSSAVIAGSTYDLREITGAAVARLPGKLARLIVAGGLSLVVYAGMFTVLLGVKHPAEVLLCAVVCATVSMRGLLSVFVLKMSMSDGGTVTLTRGSWWELRRLSAAINAARSTV